MGPYSGRPTRFFTAFPIKGRKIGDRAGREQREMSSFLPGGGPRHQLRPCRRRGLGNAVHVAVAVEVHLVEEVSSVHSTLNGFYVVNLHPKKKFYEATFLANA